MVQNAIGIVRVGDLQIVVGPKIPLAHFVYLLTLSGEVPRFVRDDVGGAPSRTLLELIAHWFMFAVDLVLKQDLIRDYVDTTDAIAVVRGQLDALATGAEYYSGRLSMSCRFDDFELDTALNRILKAGVTVIASDLDFPADLRRSAWRASQRLDVVGPLRPADLGARSDRRTAHYDDALTLARLLIERQGRTAETGNSFAWAFLIPTPDVVERGVRAVLAEGLAGVCAVTKGGLTLEPSSLRVNPDIVFGRGESVADVKYKVDWEEFPRPDLYQAVAFAAAYGSQRAGLISFKTRPRSLLVDAPFRSTVVRHLTWDASRDVAASEAADALVRATRSWLGLEPLPSVLDLSA